MNFSKMRLSLGLLLILVICDQLNAGLVGRKQKYRFNRHHSSGDKRSFNRKCGYDVSFEFYLYIEILIKKC